MRREAGRVPVHGWLGSGEVTRAPVSSRGRLSLPRFPASPRFAHDHPGRPQQILRHQDRPERGLTGDPRRAEHRRHRALGLRQERHPQADRGTARARPGQGDCR